MREGRGQMRSTPLRSLAPLALTALVIGGCKKEAEPAAAGEATQALAPRAAEARASDLVYAASSHLRFVDVDAGRVVGGIELQKAVRVIRFSHDGRFAFVAASDGVRRVDVVRGQVAAKLTERPARHLELDDTGRRLFVLEHDVVVKPDGSREPLPYELVTFDAQTGEELAREEVGQRVLYAHPAGSGTRPVVVTEAGELKIGEVGGKLAAAAEVPVFEDGPPERGYRLQVGAFAAGGKVFLPVESDPSRVLAIDLASGQRATLDLGRMTTLRGIALTPDGRRLVVNTGKEVLLYDLEARRVAGALEIEGGHAQVAVSSDGRFAHLARTVDGTGGAVTVIGLDPLAVTGKIHLEDISPWALAVRPQPAKPASR